MKLHQSTHRHRAARFKPRSNNHFELLIDGNRYAPAMLEAIASAKKHIYLECYLIESGVFSGLVLDALIAAANRGIRVFVIFDHFGGMGLQASDRAKLIHPAISLIWYNPVRLRQWLHNFHRDHRKMLIVDSRVGFIGGFGLTDRFWQGDQTAVANNWTTKITSLPWHETVLRVQGPVLLDWIELFRSTWGRAGGEELSGDISSPASSGQMTGRLAWASGHLYQGIIREFVARVRKANRRIYIATPYFVPSWRIRRVLRSAAKRGVDVRLLLPGAETDHPGARFASWRYYRKLLMQGVRIYEYQPAFIHAKVILCDDWVSVGSCNLDHWNQRWNLEANQEVWSAEFANQVAEFFDEDFQRSEEQVLQNWLKPYWRRRLLAFIWGKIDNWLMRLG